LSFASDVRKELYDIFSAARHCLLAEMSALILSAGNLDGSQIKFLSSNKQIQKKYYRLVELIFGSDESNILCVDGIKKAAGIEPDRHLNKTVVMGQCCRRAFIRGSFIAIGTLSNPENFYHAEFVYPKEFLLLAENIIELLQSFGLKPKQTERKAHIVIYLKESENIADLLNIMEAHKSLMQLENVRILKEMRNDVNRRVNFETANLTKTVNAAVAQSDAIQYIANTKGLSYLPEQLEAVARLRLEYETASLAEIGRMLSPTVGKSGVNHRLRKINEIAEELRGENN